MSLHIGAVGVAKVTSILLENGFLVSHPIYDNGYDLITDHRGILKRVQVKTTNGVEGPNRTKLKFFALRGTGFNQNWPKKVYARNILDAFIFYHTKHNAVFVVPFEKLPKTMSVYFAPNCEWRDNWDVLRTAKRG